MYGSALRVLNKLLNSPPYFKRRFNLARSNFTKGCYFGNKTLKAFLSFREGNDFIETVVRVNIFESVILYFSFIFLSKGYCFT